ncbi:MAG: HD domain-containing phosphohydrolase [Candidatus Omnitrophota bacterium]
MTDFSEMFDNQNQKKEPPGKKKKDKPDSSGIDFSSFIGKDGFSAPKSKPDPKPNSAGRIEFSEIKEGVGSQPDPADVKDTYNNAVALAQKIFSTDLEFSSKELKQVQSIVEELITYVNAEDQQVLEYVFSIQKDQKIDPTVLSFLNVCVLSLEIGVVLGYGRDELLKLGTVAFLHDIGMKEYRNLISLNRKLTDEEKAKLKHYPVSSAEIIKRIQYETGPDTSIADIIEQVHERIDGSGYPKGLTKDEICEPAQIIGLVDVYEALTHPRPYRDEYSPLEAIRIILEDKKSFSEKLAKIMLERIGIYPRGTFVKLNTEEIARVIKQNPKISMRPVVHVEYDQEGNKLETPRTIDLSQGTRIYITGSL